MKLSWIFSSLFINTNSNSSPQFHLFSHKPWRSFHHYIPKSLLFLNDQVVFLKTYFRKFQTYTKVEKRYNEPPVSTVCMLSHSIMSNSLQPHGLQSIRLLCPWDFSGKNNEVGFHFLLQGIFLTQGQNLRLLHWQVDSSPWATTREAI